MQTSAEIHGQTEGLRLVLPAPHTIRHAETFYDSIREALLNYNKVILDLSTDADPDLSFLQLIEVARQYAATQNKHLFLEKPASSLVRERLKVAGLATKGDRNSSLFWFHQEAYQ